ncbi:MAG: hypothetical protein IPN34_10135 [Planctomycetes bacterium]|nr:hypothetical protein [Planctomycetota bacterium]
MSRAAWPILRAAAAAFAVLLCDACSYRFGPGEEADEPWELETRSLAVPIFDNKSYRQGLEFELTRYFVEELHLRAPVTVVAEPEGAEAVVRGTITQVRDRVRQEDSEDRVVAAQVELTVELLLEYRDGRRVGPLRHIEVAEYVSFRGESRQTATAEVLRDAARELVLRIGRARAESGELAPDREQRIERR